MRVLHVPFHFEPTALGGTEIYVQALAKASIALGQEAVVAAPGPDNCDLVHDGIPVSLFSTGIAPDPLLDAYGEPNLVAAQNFEKILARLRPHIVHLHARTAAVSLALIDRAKKYGAQVAFTYHTPTVSCARGDMMLFGDTPCDGHVEAPRCTKCLLHKHGVRGVAATSLMLSAPYAAPLVHRMRATGSAPTALRLPALVAARSRSFFNFLDACGHVVAVCDWVADVLRRNGVPDHKLTTSRQGLPLATIPAMHVSGRKSGEPLCIGFFGRLDPTKGLECLINALAAIPHAPVKLLIHGVIQAGADRYPAGLRSLAGNDPRVLFKPAAPAHEVVQLMHACDLIAIPSIWLETGPLVALEAFAAGRPVLGSRRGGIAELVTDGRDGMLLPAGDVSAWAKAILFLEQNRDRVDDLAAGVRPPRLMADVAAEMAALYRKILARETATA